MGKAWKCIDEDGTTLHPLPDRGAMRSGYSITFVQGRGRCPSAPVARGVQRMLRSHDGSQHGTPSRAGTSATSKIIKLGMMFRHKDTTREPSRDRPPLKMQKHMRGEIPPFAPLAKVLAVLNTWGKKRQAVGNTQVSPLS